MANEKHIQFFDPVTSMGINASRRGFLPSGRYYGFDFFDGVDKISHTKFMTYTDGDNILQTTAVAISDHGVVIFVDSGVSLTITPGPWELDKFQVLYGEYIFPAVAGGNTFSLGTGGILSTEPEEPSSVPGTTTQFPIGYFKFLAGNSIDYVPYSTPFLGREGLDLENVAKLDLPNRFLKSNSRALQNLSITSLLANTDVTILFPGETLYTLQVPENGNVINLDLTGWVVPAQGRLIISKVDMVGTDYPGTDFVIKVINIPDGLMVIWMGQGDAELLNSNNLRFGFEGFISFTESHRIWLVRYGTYWECIASFDWAQKETTLLGNRVGINENELVNHENRITQLEASGVTWNDLVSPGTSVGQWTVNALQTYVDSNSMIHFRCALVSTAGMAAGNIVLGNFAIGVLRGIPMATTGPGSRDLLGVLSIDNGDDSVSWDYPTVSGANIHYGVSDIIVGTE